ncbi:CdaR family protein [Lactobacillus agrestimuris]|uniref:CdaR family protein n=1 Tax=Lactobacillus agrestimuris TaxID=2941328 RepID=UPI002044A256|nr:CdaR family protein [Lactobacillus agrestimuris]
MKNFWSKTWVIRIVSLLLAILIVVYIDSTQTGFISQIQQNKTRQTATETRTIKVPLQVSVDTDQYYVVGYPEKVKITLEGSNALVTSAINTQNFRAYIDLGNQKIGQHTVPVRVSGLSKQINYQVNPKTIKVDIERRKSRTLPVQIEYNKNAVAKGYHFGKTSADPNQVEVTGALSEVNQIDQIVAKVSLPNGIDHNFERQVILTAVDKKGRPLNVVIEPSTARVVVPISIAKKKVKLSLNSKNENSNKVYSVTAKQSEVTLFGDKTKLDKIDEVSVDIDLNKIISSTTETYPIKLPSGVVKSDPDKVQISIKVKNTRN